MLSSVVPAYLGHVRRHVNASLPQRGTTRAELIQNIYCGCFEQFIYFEYCVYVREGAMSALLARDDTVVPTEEDSRIAAESSRVLASAAVREREMRVQLENGQTLVLPQGAARLLSHLLTEMGRGNAVTLIPV